MSEVTPKFNARASQSAGEASIDAKRERVTEFAHRSFERCKDKWTARNYDRLLKREGNAPSLQPSFAVNDRKAHLMRAAGNLALQRHHKNVARINHIADHMIGCKRDEIGR